MSFLDEEQSLMSFQICETLPLHRKNRHREVQDEEREKKGGRRCLDVSTAIMALRGMVLFAPDAKIPKKLWTLRSPKLPKAYAVTTQ